MRNFKDNVKKSGTIMKIIGVLTLVLNIILVMYGSYNTDFLPPLLNTAYAVVLIILGARINKLEDINIHKYLWVCFFALLLMSIVTGRIGGILIIIAYANLIFGLDSFYRLKKYHNLTTLLSIKKYPFWNNALLYTSLAVFLYSIIVMI